MNLVEHFLAEEMQPPTPGVRFCSVSQLVAPSAESLVDCDARVIAPKRRKIEETLANVQRGDEAIAVPRVLSSSLTRADTGNRAGRGPSCCWSRESSDSAVPPPRERGSLIAKHGTAATTWSPCGACCFIPVPPPGLRPDPSRIKRGASAVVQSGRRGCPAAKPHPFIGALMPRYQSRSEQATLH